MISLSFVDGCIIPQCSAVSDIKMRIGMIPYVFVLIIVLYERVLVDNSTVSRAGYAYKHGLGNEFLIYYERE